MFCDFGDNFKVVDTNGEEPLSIMVNHITRDKEGVVTCTDEARHGLESGHKVTFSEIEVRLCIEVFKGCLQSNIYRAWWS